MFIKVKRKPDATRITHFTMGDFPSLEFPDNTDEFNIPIEHLADLRAYFDPYFPPSQQEKAASTFMLGDKSPREE